MAGLEKSMRIVQLKVRLLGLSPMIWRRVLVPESVMLRELHGILQVGMGWDGIHLYYFDIHAMHYCWADVTVGWNLRTLPGELLVYGKRWDDEHTYHACQEDIARFFFEYGSVTGFVLQEAWHDFIGIGDATDGPC